MGAPSQTPTVDEEERLWTAAEAARYLNVSRSWVYRETSAGRLPHSRILGLVRYDPARIRALKEAGEQKPGRVVIPLTPKSA